jgi:uncharacterized protein (TIRG00374 family)
MPGRRTILILGALLGSLFLYLAVRKVDWPTLIATLSHAHPGYVGLGLLSMLAFFGVKAWRWRYLIHPFAQATTRELLPPVLAGLAGNYVFPHVGEVARAVLASQRVKAPVSALLASVAIERIFDFLAILVIVLAVLEPVGRMSAEIQAASYVVGALCAGIFAAVVLFLFRTEACLRFAKRLLSLVSERLSTGVLTHLRAASAGLGAIARPRIFVPIFLLSVLQWMLIVASMTCSLKAVHAPVTLAGAASAMLWNVIGLTLPAAPGHVGTVQLAFVIGLTPFGVTHADAFAGSVIYNCLAVVPSMILGFSGLRRAGVELRDRLFGR